MTTTAASPADPTVAPGADGADLDVARVRRAPALLRAFNDVGVLAPADVHVARTAARLAGEDRDEVLLAAALAVRAPRLQHVCVDLATVRGSVTADDDAVDLDALPWPEPAAWLDAVAHSPLVAVDRASDGDAEPRPLRLVGSRLYLDRYHRYERRVVAALTTRAGEDADDVDVDRLRADLDALFGPADPDEPDLQRLAAATAVLRRVAVIAGGPGTGKTTTVARVLALLVQQAVAAGRPAPRIALAAPTGKAAARLTEAVAATAADLDLPDDVAAVIADTSASTLHRLLGTAPGSRTRFRHDRERPLPHDVVVVDETSMVSLALVAKLLDAVRPDARLVLLGDPEQLASVEAGAVLGDVVGPATRGLRQRPAVRAALEAVTGEPVAPAPAADAAADMPTPPSPIADSVVVLRRVHRFAGESGIAALAAAVQAGDADAAVDVLAAGRDDVRWLDLSVVAEGPTDRRLAPLRAAAASAGAAVTDAAVRGDARAALDALGDFRVLCAHRRGPAGVATWVPMLEWWLAADVPGFVPAGAWYAGRPVLVTANDYQLGVFNGDVGVAGAFDGDRLLVAFEDAAVRRDDRDGAARGRGGDGVRLLSPARLDALETVHAMTVHKSQGSQFRGVAVVLPDADSPLLSRELLYTAVTRAREEVLVVGTADAVRAAVTRRVQRASGLREALWGPDA